MVLFTQQERRVVLFCGAVLIMGTLFIAGSRISPTVENVLFALELHALLPKIEINTAAAQQFETLPGIGPAVAKRIVKYRRMIGGFDDIDQLKKVYGLSDETFKHIRPRICVRPRAE